MPLIQIQLPIRSNVTKHGVEGNARIVNAYVEELGKDSKHPFAVYDMPGYSDFATLSGGGRVRAMLAMGAKLYTVSDRVVSVVDQAGTETILGGLAVDGPAYFGRNRRDPAEIGLVSGGVYKVIDTGTDTMQDVEIAGVAPPFSFDVVDGYGMLPGPGDTFFITDVDNFTSISLADFASAESKPDRIRRVIEFQNAAWFLGAKTTEPWQNTGDTFPFRRITQIPVGCIAPGSAAIADDRLIWVDDNRQVRMSSGGYDLQVISNHDVSRAIEKETDQENMTATSFAFQGHHFYVLNGTNFSWQFDVKTGSWSERKSGALSRWRIDAVEEFNGSLIAGDYANGKLYTMSVDNLDEAGTALVSQVQFPQVHAFPLGLKFNALYLDVHTGVGLNTTDAANLDPAIMLDWSDDGGESWSNVRHLPLGRLANNLTRVKTQRLGSLRRNGRIFRVSKSADVKCGVFGAALDAERLSN
jgi:hypothetical protein